SRVCQLLADPALRAGFSRRAENKARKRSDPEVCVRAYEQVFADAQRTCPDTLKRSSLVERAAPVMSWAALHTLLAGLGCVRPPAIVNRHGRQQPDWDLTGIGVGPGAGSPGRLRLVS